MPWYVVQTHFKEELKAVDNLRAQRFFAYCPLLRLKDRSVPMFSGYVFVKFKMRGGKWRKISNTRGCKRLLGVDAEKPIPISTEMIMRMKEQEKELGYVVEVEKVFTAGMKLKLLSGPLAGKIGTCVKSAGGRVSLLLYLLGGENVVYSSITNVELADQ